ncbi:hypothetical protein [Streptomyces inusitatus]|uniref:hypothetical protein n=1 Tax=Streptomyces inusitatus TaxID=68221 RepID=UPI00167EB6C7|nr:hypothetical protein [Streptomyces inusitatus]
MDASVLETDVDGRARWTFMLPFTGLPVLSAVAVDPDPGGEQPVVAVLEEVAATHAVLRVWWVRPQPGSGVAEPAGPGVRVHVTARPVSG